MAYIACSDLYTRIAFLSRVFFFCFLCVNTGGIQEENQQAKGEVIFGRRGSWIQPKKLPTPQGTD